MFRELFNDVRGLSNFVSKKDYKKVFLLFIMMLFDAALAAIGVGVIPLYMAFLLNPSKVTEVPYFDVILPQLPSKITPVLAIVASLVLLSVIVVKNFFAIVLTYVQLKFVNTTQAYMSEKMFRIYQSASYEWLLSTNTSELVRKIQFDTGEIASKVLMPLFELAKNSLILVFILAVMIVGIHWKVMVILFFMSIGLFILQTAMRGKIKETGKIIREEVKNNIQNIQQGFGAIIDTRLLRCEKNIFNVYKKSVRRAAKARWIQGSLSRSMPPLIEILSVVVLLSAFLVQIKANSSLEEGLPGMTLLVVAVTRLKQISSSIALSVNNIHAGRVFMPAIILDIRKHEKIMGHKIPENNSENSQRFIDMKLIDVNYTYDKKKHPAIKNINIFIARGESVGFIGSTGSGKSTLVNVILGLLEPQQGSININGKKLQGDMSEWWKMIGYVPQSIYLVDNTIRANIAFGIKAEDIDDKRLETAVKSSQLEQFIKELPDGLDTIVGERGVKLSGGQRQRIGIARALYPDPQVLVMDEATSALDNKTEKELMETIENLMGEKTMIMIAHRLTTVEKCDRLYLLDHGVILHSGKYRDLIDASDHFRRMVYGADVQPV